MKSYRKTNSADGTAVYIDPFSIEVRPGVKVRDLETALQCAHAIEELEAQIAQVATQIEAVKAGKMRVASDWLHRAEGAKRWQKRAMKAVRQHAAVLRSVTVGVDRWKILLDVILDDIGEEAMDRYIATAKAARPDVFASTDQGSA